MKKQTMIKLTRKVTNPVKKTTVALKKGAKLPGGKGMKVSKTVKKYK